MVMLMDDDLLDLRTQSLASSFEARDAHSTGQTLKEDRGGVERYPDDVALDRTIGRPENIRLASFVRYFVTRCLVGVTVLAGAASEIENVSQVFQPDGRLAASNSPYPFKPRNA